MIVSRLVSFFFRFVEFACATVRHSLINRVCTANIQQGVLAIAAHFIHVHEAPLGRNAYAAAIAALSVILSVLWLIPRTSAMLHFAGDAFLAMAWFTAFGIEAQWIKYHNRCASGAFQWRGALHGGRCGRWKAMEAMSFIGAIFWVASAMLSLWVERRARKGAW